MEVMYSVQGEGGGGGGGGGGGEDMTGYEETNYLAVLKNIGNQVKFLALS